MSRIPALIIINITDIQSGKERALCVFVRDEVPIMIFFSYSALWDGLEDKNNSDFI
jgi:hypothetical protein